MKQNGFLLGARPVVLPANEKRGALDLTRVFFAVDNGQGGLEPVEYFYGKSSETKSINNMVTQNGGYPVLAELDLLIQRDFKTSANVARLSNFLLIKQ